MKMLMIGRAVHKHVNLAINKYNNQSGIMNLTSKNKTVLYVEDNPVNLDLVIRFLAKYPDIEVLSSMNAEDGLLLIKNQLPDLILLDINLPGMSGYDMLAKLKHNDLTNKIPVVALTADVMMQDIENGFESGFDDYLTKPLDLEMFRTTALDFLGMNDNNIA